MKLTRENIYINLQGKSKEELIDLYNFLKIKIGKKFISLKQFLIYCEKWEYYTTESDNEWFFCTSLYISNKTEVTIQQLKETLQPMGTFTPIAMKCTKEQFEAIKPKLEKIGKIGCLISAFETYDYITNNYGDEVNYFDFVTIDKERWGFQLSKFYHEWNEEIFLKACGIEVETLQEKALRLENELKEVKQKIEEENKPKVGDYVYNTDEELFYKKTFEVFNQYERKITNTELIKLLEQEIK